jgi:hypothetical protein
VAQLVAADWQALGLDHRRPGPRAHRALHDARQQRADDRDLERRHHGVPVHRQPEGRPPLQPATIFAVETRTWYATGGERGIEPTGGIKRIVDIIEEAKTVGVEQQIELAKELFTSRRRALRHRHRRPDPHDPGRRGRQRGPQERAARGGQRLAAAHAGRRAPRAVLLRSAEVLASAGGRPPIDRVAPPSGPPRPHPRERGASPARTPDARPARPHDGARMHWFILKRLLVVPVLLFIFSIISFVLIQAPPGDFLTSYIAELTQGGSSVDQAQIDALRRTYGLDRPMVEQYFTWIGRLLRATSACRSSGTAPTPT